MFEISPSQLNELRPGTQFQQYHLLEQIGVGGQGVVWSALDQAHARIVAIKFIEVSGTDEKKIDDLMLERQAGKLLTLRHPHILPLYDFGLAEQIRYMVSPYVTGGSLADWLNSNRHTIDQALRYAAEIASALDYLHAQGVVHRDLKPGNVLIDLSQNTYVADFGLARSLSESTRIMHTGRGTPPYSPPEQHTMAEMTPQSDIYNFGVMLYELLTLQLPWEGQKALGLEQLQANEQIPDPCQVNPKLPSSLVTVLRQMTAAAPDGRPRTAGQAMRRVLECFGSTSTLDLDKGQPDEAALRRVDAQKLLKRYYDIWKESGGKTILSLTKFALVDLEYRQADQNSMPAVIKQFMLQHALAYGYNDDFWWQVTPAAERLSTASGQLNIFTEDVTTRVVNHLLKDPKLRAFKKPLPEEMKASLLNLAKKTNDPWLRQECLEVLLALIPAANSWRETAINPEQDLLLADLALHDSSEGKAAQLIGHLRSKTATQKLLQEVDAEKRALVLHMIQQAAGSLPASTPFKIRVGVTLRWMAKQLTVRPLTSLAAYGLAVLGVTLGFGSIVYLTYRLPEFLDTMRISVSLERGLFLGLLFGFGIFLTRLIVERFPKTNLLLRTALATLLGGTLLNLAMAAYDILMLGSPPAGLLLTAGCLLIAAGFALGSLGPNRLWKVGLSFAALFTALAGSWMAHLSWAPSPSDLTPLFRFEYTASMPQVMGVVFLAVLPPAILGSLVDLSDKE